MGSILQAGFMVPIIYLDNLISRKKNWIAGGSGFKDHKSPILFYIHYSKECRLSELELSTLDNIKRLGVQISVTFNDDSPNEKRFEELKKLYSTRFDCIILRKNIGYDLGAYRDTLQHFSRSKKNFENKVFFMNNSVLWFPSLITEYFKKVLDLEADVFAGSISTQHNKHIQTFLFGALSKDGFEALEDWFRLIKNWHTKRAIVTFGELQTSILFDKHIKILSYPSLNQLVESGIRKIQDVHINQESSVIDHTTKRLQQNRELLFNGIPSNPTHNYWLEMLEFGFPGIKYDLIKRNPSGILDYEVLVSKLLKYGITFDQIGQMLLNNKPKSIILKIRRAVRI